MEPDRTRTATDGWRRETEEEEPARGGTVGRFVLLDKLGEGGMGVVYAAYDPELDRKVALKLVRPALGAAGAGRARLLREAQALARLSHPNVVTIHDVGTHDEQVWIAMEFVAGETLGDWAQARARRWQELLAVLTDAARGVAAAHAAGLVHRDLKPDNVMIGGDGRVRVMDFGLAHGRGAAITEPGIARSVAVGTTLPEGLDLVETAASGPEVRPEHAALAERLTGFGAIQGTPAYMAPEQWRGEEAEAATDQFGFSVMAWELLYGERPFAGATVEELSRAVLAGTRRAPPRGRGVPRWLHRVLERGLASEPQRRFPTMAALLAELARGRTRARVRAAGLVLAGAGVIAAGVEAGRRWDLAQREAACVAAGAEIEAVWNEPTRAGIRAAFVSTGLGYAATTADKVMPWLDEAAASWRATRTDVCRRATVTQTWSAELLDRATWCLEDRKMELASLLTELGRTEAPGVQRAVAAASGLRPVADCLDEEALLRAPTPPVQGREALQAVRMTLAQVNALQRAGKGKEALARVTEARAQAEGELEWPPLVAAARAREGDLLQLTGAYEAAERASTDAYIEAIRAEAPEVAAGAASSLIGILGAKRARPAEARLWARLAEVAIVQAGDRSGLREARRLGNLAITEAIAGDRGAARAAYERALALKEATLGPHHPDVALTLNNLGNLLVDDGAYAEALAIQERVLAIREQTLGADNPDVAFSLSNIATVRHATGAYAEARALLERALALKEQAAGREHPSLCSTLSSLGAVLLATGAEAEAEAMYARGAAIAEKKFGPEHPEVATQLGGLARVHHAAGRHAEARGLFERAAAIFEKTRGPDHPELATVLGDLGALLADTGGRAEARGLLERALAIREEAFGPEHPEFAVGLAGLGALELEEGRLAEAVPLLERAVAILDRVAGVQPGEIEARFRLARALVGADGDRARALAEATKAREALRAVAPGKVAALAAIEAWLRGQEPPGGEGR